MGTLNATGGGCAANQGDGAPTSHECCNNAGGSYGGVGIAGKYNERECSQTDPPPCDTFVKQPYGDEDFFSYQGSGGGGLQGGAGGGSIWITIANSLEMTGTIEARGTHSKSTNTSTYGSGGGSGGAVNMQVYNITGSSLAKISVAGGNGKYGGGGGSGGWVYGTLFDSVNKNTALRSRDWTGNIYNSYGNSISSISTESITVVDDYNHYGKIYHPECLAGYEKAFCSPCIQGFYKSSTSRDDCLTCTNKPNLNSQYIRNPGNQTSPKCDYD